jgi:hypothetical protein
MTPAWASVASSEWEEDSINLGLQTHIVISSKLVQQIIEQREEATEEISDSSPIVISCLSA